MCSLSKKHTSVCVLLLLLSSSLIPLDFQNIVICCWKMSRTAKIVSIEPPDPISDPRVEEILMEMNVEVVSANKKAIRSIHKWSIQLYYLCCIIGGMCFIPREKFLTKRDIRRQSLGILSKDIILLYRIVKYTKKATTNQIQNIKIRCYFAKFTLKRSCLSD